MVNVLWKVFFQVQLTQWQLFLNNAIYKIIENPIERKHNSYAIQYKLDSWDKLDHYFKNYAPKLQAITKTKYGENVLAFRTFLEEI